MIDMTPGDMALEMALHEYHMLSVNEVAALGEATEGCFWHAVVDRAYKKVLDKWLAMAQTDPKQLETHYRSTFT